MIIIVEQIYRLARQYFDQFHPGALLASEKFKMHDHPEEILKIAARYSDVISVQPGPARGPDVGQGPDESVFDASYWQRLHEVTGKPIFICDQATSFRTEDYPRTLWHQFETEEDAAQHYAYYLRNVIAEPYIAGYQRCQYKSRYDPLRTLLKQGLLDLEGRTYEKLVDQVERSNESALEAVYPNQ